MGKEDNDPELDPSRVPWKEGNNQGYELVKLSIKRGSHSPEFDALTIYKHRGNITLTRWTWKNHYGRDWSRGEGSWDFDHTFTLSTDEAEKLRQIWERKA